MSIKGKLILLVLAAIIGGAVYFGLDRLRGTQQVQRVLIVEKTVDMDKVKTLEDLKAVLREVEYNFSYQKGDPVMEARVKRIEKFLK